LFSWAFASTSLDRKAARTGTLLAAVRAVVRPGLLGMAFLVHAASGCADTSANAPSKPASWAVVEEELDSALISVWGSAEDDVWAVGSDRGEGPLVLHWDGQKLEKLDTGATGDLWWVYGFADGPVFMGGAGGNILRYEDGEFAPTSTPRDDVTVFGLWGSSPQDMWAVGASDGGADGAFAWRLEVDEWLDAPGFPEDLATDKALWKVWGSAADDVWLVGTAGVAVHWDGSSFETANVGGGESLFTVHYGGGRFVAVGGGVSGLVFENDGEGWQPAEHDALYALIGVHVTSRGRGYAVGRFGAVVEERDGKWQDTEGPDTIRTLHSVWADPAGGLWTVGGELDVRPMVAGVLAYRGNNQPSGMTQ
jgi:hypothetical protein